MIDQILENKNQRPILLILVLALVIYGLIVSNSLIAGGFGFAYGYLLGSRQKLGHLEPISKKIEDLKHGTTTTTN